MSAFLIRWSLVTLLAFVILCVTIMLNGCPTPVCSTMATRCSGSRAEVCSSDGQWQLVADCAENEGWSCQPVEDLHACQPVTR